eukprot:TRINITY_DN6661_c0_g1_i2.p1 TRINITY_DN6661_c0_g1~~TRINITY_DN6661_c0_g1_i2.p1  ORF type:complete len:231 (+),score=69.92 TRINITY_DN6661_c0_g1_i2:577-1269(+)
MFQNLTVENLCEVFRATQHSDIAGACARFFAKQDIEHMALQRSFIDLPAADVYRLIATLRKVCEPCDEYLFRVLWRWADGEQGRLQDPVWSSLFADGLVEVSQLSPPTVIGKVKTVVPSTQYVRLLEKVVSRGSEEVGPLDEEGFPASLLLRYGSVKICPVPVIEAAVVRVLKRRYGESLPFREIVDLISAALDPSLFVISVDDVRNALVGLAARRYVDTDGVGFYQYRP